ncbi:hypothetical protein COY33_00420 [candidate division WWE3 bacterium CG_4_10_14_0_2_um_filter_42_7]|uniref:BACON domain-containing protein n=2 Tax=Katanobacteria TaxID=422282 RepID=A0A2H0X988_UNCKA|nr:MAG: hypothetical protein COT51_02495 [candidate division WWE3 bacterium CG08_land_8_20_14_0_20_41_15]PIZ43993.1 MAG: hypothetical protein COY33_00420 [candidate division WWE3 bacterium CG_4_10_14_0_2_um_filter_42_7]
MKSILPKKIALISLLFISVSAIAISGVLTLKKKILPDKSQAAETYPKCQHTTTCPERIGTSPSGLYNNNNTFEPIIYNMHGFGNVNWREWKPEFGPIGEWFYFGWSELQPSSADDSQFTPLENRLINVCGDQECYVEYPQQNNARTYKPVAISVGAMYECKEDSPLSINDHLLCDQTPNWFYSGTGITRVEVPLVENKSSANCPAHAYVPPFDNSAWQQAYANMVTTLGNKYKNDRIVDSVWIMSGFYGEAISKISYRDFGGVPGICYYETNPKFEQWANTLPQIYRSAFGTKPIFMMITKNDMKKDLIENIIANGIAIKTNTLAPDSNSSYQTTGQLGLTQLIEKYKRSTPIAYEHAYGDSDRDTYWSILYALTHGASFIDLDGDIGDRDGAGSDWGAGEHFFGRLANGVMPWGEKLWDFYTRHINRGPGKALQSDDAFIVLRDTIYPYETTGDRSYISGEPGDWEFHLYRLENTCRDTTYATADIKPMVKRSNEDEWSDTCNGIANRDVGGGTTYLKSNQVGEGVIGGYGARKMVDSTLYFMVDPSWAARGYPDFSLSVTYKGGSGSFGIKYCDTVGQQKTATLPKEAGDWVTGIARLTGVDFRKTCGLNGGANFAITGSNDIIHMVAIAPGFDWPPNQGPAPRLSVNQRSFQFDLAVGEDASEQTAVIGGDQTKVIDWSATIYSSQDTCANAGKNINVEFSPQNGRTDQSRIFIVNPNTSSVSQSGSCYKTIKITPTGGEGYEDVSSVLIRLNFTFTTPKKVNPQPRSLSFTANTGANPATKTLTVSKDAGATGVAWAATPNTSWITVSSVTGNSSSPTTITVSLIPVERSLTAGTHTGKITFTSTEDTTISEEVTVSLVIGSGTGTTVNLHKGWNKVTWSSAYGYLRPSTVPTTCVLSGKYRGWFGNFVRNFGLNITSPANGEAIYVKCTGDASWSM